MSTQITKSGNRHHAIHYRGVADLERDVTTFGKDAVFRYKNADHAVVTGTLRHVEHKVTPDKAIASTYFQTANQTLDYELPRTHWLDGEELRLDITNISVSGQTLESIPSNCFSRREYYYGSEIRETVTRLDDWMDQVIYKTPEEQAKLATSTQVSASTFLSAGAAAAETAFSTIRIPLRSHLSHCAVPTALVNKDISVKFYSGLDTEILSGPDGFSAQGCDLHVKEFRGSEGALVASAGRNLDWRYLKGKLQEETVTLTSGNETSIKLSNFSESDLCSHMWLFIRTADLSQDGRDDMLSCVTQAWVEDEGGQNIANGLRPSGDHLLRMTYPDKFLNIANSVHGLYLVHCPAANPFEDYRNGTMSGAQPLSKNMVLKFVPNVSGSHVVSVVSMNHQHVRWQNGDVTIN
jgi:hypothetical protein